MIKIKVSYERPEELRKLLDRLGQDVKRIKAPRQPKGKFPRAYIDVDILAEAESEPERNDNKAG